MHGFLRVVGVLLITATFASACSSSGSARKTAEETKTSKSQKTKTAAKKPEQIKSFQTSLAQRPSEINIPVRGKITRTGEVYLLRGLANVFSRGMDTLGAKMVRSGLDARVYNHAAWRELADNIILRNKKKQVSYPVVIMGHSLGANASVLMANYLGANGVKVSYVVSFDPTQTGIVGKNVNRVVNFYLPNDSNSNVVRRGRGFKGAVKNVNSRGVRGLKHTTIEKDAKYHAEVIKRTLTYTKKRRKKRS